MQDIGRKILALAVAMVPGRFETQPATQRTHPHVDWKAYYRVRKRAAALGFRHLGDVDVTSFQLGSSMMKRPVLALFASDDGTIVLGHYRLPLRWTLKGLLGRFMGGRGDVFDVGTHFDGGDGVTLETTNAEPAGVWNMPDFVLRETLGRGCPLDHLVQRHRERVRDYRRERPEARPHGVRTLRDVVVISDSIERRKLAWRRDLGWVTRDELARLSKLGDSVLDELYTAFQDAARERSS